MKDFQLRVVDEKNSLDVNIVKLSGFIFSDKFTDVEKDEQGRMERQLYTMMEYSRCLRERISSF